MTDPTTNLKDAKARLSEPIDLVALRSLTRRLPRADRDAGELVRDLRDDARY